MAQQMTGAEMVIEALKDQGITHIFGYPGGAALPIYDAMFQQDDVQHILVRHDVLLDYGRSVLVDEARPLPQNLARLNLARAFLVDGTTILHADRKFLLAALPPAR